MAVYFDGKCMCRMDMFIAPNVTIVCNIVVNCTSYLKSVHIYFMCISVMPHLYINGVVVLQPWLFPDIIVSSVDWLPMCDESACTLLIVKLSTPLFKMCKHCVDYI